MTRLRRATRKTFVALSVRRYPTLFHWPGHFGFRHLDSNGGADLPDPLHSARDRGRCGDRDRLQFLPMLFFGTFGGLIADRVDKRKMLYATQGSAAVLALAFGLLVVTGSPN